MKDVFGGCGTLVIGIDSQVVSEGSYMAVTSTQGRQIAEGYNCDQLTVLPWDGSGWEGLGGQSGPTFCSKFMD